MDDKIKFMQSKGSAEDVSHENEVSKHGGKREGAGRPLGSKSKSLWKTIEDMAEKYQHSPCLLYTSPSPRDGLLSRMPSSA